MYQSFRWAFLVYLLLPTTLLVLKITILAWQFEWLVLGLQEVSVLCIYIFIAANFLPSRQVSPGVQPISKTNTCPALR